MTTAKCPKIKAAKVIPGRWRADVLDGGTVHLGGATNMAPTQHAIEFSWMTLSAVAYGPNKVVLPAAIVLMAPAETVSQEHPGMIMQNGLVAMIDLSITRLLFSDLLTRIESGKVKSIAFEVKEGGNHQWPILSWGTVLKLSNR